MAWGWELASCRCELVGQMGGQSGQDGSEGVDDLGGASKVPPEDAVEFVSAVGVLGDSPGAGGFEVSVDGGDGVEQRLGGAWEVEVDETAPGVVAQSSNGVDRLFVDLGGTRPARWRWMRVVIRLMRLPKPPARSWLATWTSRSAVKSVSTTGCTSRANHHRSASMPYRSTSSRGSRVAPPDLEIFAPARLR